MTDAIKIIIIANVIPLIVAISTWLKSRKIEKRLSDKEGRELSIKEAASSIDGWKELNKLLRSEVDRLWDAQKIYEETKTQLEKRIHELEAINKELVAEVKQLKEQVAQLLTKLKE